MKVQPRRVLAAVLLAGCLVLAGCAAAGEPTTPDAEPVEVKAISGTELNRVVVSAEASRNIGIETQPVRAAPLSPGAAAPWTTVPITAVIYDPAGASWVYTNPALRTFVRASVAIERTDATSAILTSGPPVGTAVVTVGASELIGAEYGVGGE